MSSARDAAPAGGGQVAVPTGNTFDKYGSTNPAVRRLMAGFEGTLAGLFDQAAPESVLDVGCGEGVLTYRWAEQLGTRPVLGIDLADPKLEVEWSTRRRPNLEFRAMVAEELPFPDRSFDLAAAIEVLEHVPDPERTLAEMARVAARHLLDLRPARAAVADAERRPGRVRARSRQHPRTRQPLVQAELRADGRPARRGARGALPVPVDDAAGEGRVTEGSRPPAGATVSPPPRPEPGPGHVNGGDPSAKQPSYASGARVLSIGIASTGIFTFLYLATASHALDPASYSRISLCWAIMFVILSVIYRPIEQLLSRTIADRRARGLHGHSLRIPALIQFSFAILFLIVALAMRTEIEQGIFDGSTRSTGSS